MSTEELDEKSFLWDDRGYPVGSGLVEGDSLTESLKDEGKMRCGLGEKKTDTLFFLRESNPTIQDPGFRSEETRKMTECRSSFPKETGTLMVLSEQIA